MFFIMRRKSEEIDNSRFLHAQNINVGIIVTLFSQLYSYIFFVSLNNCIISTSQSTIQSNFQVSKKIIHPQMHLTPSLIINSKRRITIYDLIILYFCVFVHIWCRYYRSILLLTWKGIFTEVLFFQKNYMETDE